MKIPFVPGYDPTEQALERAEVSIISSCDKTTLGHIELLRSVKTPFPTNPRNVAEYEVEAYLVIKGEGRWKLVYESNEE